MILLTATTDKLQLTTDAAVTVDVHASWIDLSGSTTTAGRTNTAITTATTTDIVPAPAASTQRNIKTLHIRNKHATLSVGVTVLFDQNATDFELHKVSLAAGDQLEYIEGIGFFILAAQPPNFLYANANTADVVASAADTYLTGSSLAITGRIKAGTVFRWVFAMTKTAAGTAAPTFIIRVGTAGTTADTARVTHTGPAQTAATDTGFCIMECHVRTFSASGVLQSTIMRHHINATTGLQNVQENIIQTTSAAFDLTAASLILGVSCNPGASGVWTFQVVNVRQANGA